jgi:uncharacterized membrane protein
VWHAFGLFTGTITYGLATGLLIGDKPTTSAATAVIGFVGVLGSLALGARLQRRALAFIQLPTVLDALGRAGDTVIDDIYPAAAGPAAGRERPGGQSVTQTVQMLSPGVLQEIDLSALVDLRPQPRSPSAFTSWWVTASPRNSGSCR